PLSKHGGFLQRQRTPWKGVLQGSQLACKMASKVGGGGLSASLDGENLGGKTRLLIPPHSIYGRFSCDEMRLTRIKCAARDPTQFWGRFWGDELRLTRIKGAARVQTLARFAAVRQEALPGRYPVVPCGQSGIAAVDLDNISLFA